MDLFYLLVFAACALVAAFAQVMAPRQRHLEGSPAFLAFRNNYLLVYCLMMAGDWLQGPYVYALYEYYGFDVGTIGQLFIAGFGSSLVLGTFAGTLADTHGRRLSGLMYCVFYIASCVTKHSPNYWILMLGRVFGGIATSLLFSTFESWVVSEHLGRGFDPDWLSDLFSKAVYLGNGLVAIVSGLLANLLVDTLDLGPVAPFDAAIFALGAGAIIMRSSWTVMRESPKVALLGALQGLFEGAMYTFVFLWTPALSPRNVEIPHGMIFACFMVSSMAGAAIAGRLMARGNKPEVYMQQVFLVGALALVPPVLLHTQGQAPDAASGVLVSGNGITSVGQVQLLGFLVFEVCVGIFWPSMMRMRSDHVPEEVRATMINMFRIPLNAFVLVVLYNVSKFPLAAMFGLCSLLLLVCTILQRNLARVAQGVGKGASTA